MKRFDFLRSLFIAPLVASTILSKESTKFINESGEVFDNAQDAAKETGLKMSMNIKHKDFSETYYADTYKELVDKINNDPFLRNSGIKATLK